MDLIYVENKIDVILVGLHLRFGPHSLNDSRIIYNLVLLSVIRRYFKFRSSNVVSMHFVIPSVFFGPDKSANGIYINSSVFCL